MKYKIIITLLVLPISWISIMASSLSLPQIFSDKMVLQQKNEVKIWGKGSPKQKVSLHTSWDNKDYSAIIEADSTWGVRISTPEASYTSYTLSITSGENKIVLNEVLIGEVWLCSGQSNMRMPMKGYFGQPVKGSLEDIVSSENENLRFYSIKLKSSLEPQYDCEGVWQQASIETTPNFSATAYYFGRLLQKTLNIPIGLIHASWGGSVIQAWMPKESLEAFPTIKIPTEEPERRVAPLRSTVLYNGMINPIAGYNIKGAIWYQGESGTQNYKIYPDLFKSMHQEWIKRWDMGREFPIYFCQITPYAHYKLPHFIREAQLKISQEQPNTAIAVLLDVGEKDILHCANKKAPGERLAYIALARLYGFENLPYRGPEFRSLNVVDSKLILRFRYADDGFNTFGKELNHFRIAGADKVFYPAEAKIVKNSVELSSPDVSEPIAVRYAFEPYAEACLFGINGLPVSSFRSDDWDDVE